MTETLLEKQNKEQCRKTFCKNKAMTHGNFDRHMVNALNKWHQTTTDWTLCSSCNHWLQLSGQTGLISIRDNGDWWHHNVRPEDHPQTMKGLDGKKWLITVTENEANNPKLVGKTLETTNLWVQGKIPKEYHKVMITAPGKIFVTMKNIGY